ncbi:MAG TPA: PAS domain S-box protein [Aquabacterium sp.]|uniref:PAS domain S-box protein n=1 Tax=Aquabacterium sp. TaxID=1872578 RepID=UPI002E304951|nr:PAS domain S-box protein [Aquabacterium sp.]HEX5357610.1 PAS domain S-box protein [Aquabacterium sp.]
MTQPAPLPFNEAQRLAKLRELAVLDTEPEPLFDTLTRLAAQLCGVPVALVCFVDADRQWFKSNVGLPGVHETPRDVAFCAHAILESDVMEVPDATRDARFLANPLVTEEPGIRFYAGAPIKLPDGLQLGTLCVIDRQPRILSSKQKQALAELAQIAAQALMMRERTRYQALAAGRTLAEQIANNEALYRAIVEDQTELISLSTPEGILTFVNAAYSRQYGKPTEAIVGTSLYDYVPEAERPLVRAHLSRVLSLRETLQDENRTVARDGRLHWMAWTNRPVINEKGEVTGIHSVGRDITERKLAEQSLKESKTRLRSLYESTPAMLHSIDQHGILLTVSDTWLAKMGYTREEVIGRSSADFLAPSSYEYARNVVLPRYLLTGRCDNVEYQMVRKDGSLIDVRLSAIMERDTDGQPVRSLAILEDVTEKHAVEAALHANQERLTLATQANEIGIWELTLPEGRLTWSDMMYTIFGLPREQFTGKLDDWAKCIHPEDLEYTSRELSAAIKGHKPLDFDFRVLHPNGHVRYVYGRATVFRDARGRATRVLGANYDVTDRKHMERELAEKHELLRVTLHSIGDAVITTDAHGRVQWLNPVAERMTGWPNESARNMPLSQVFHVVNEQTREPEVNPFERCLAEDIHMGQVDQTLLISRNGQEYGIEDSAAPIRDEDGNMLGVVLVFHDVTEQRRMGHEMSFRATHDQLTGLVNRAEFDKRLTRVLGEAHQHDTCHALMYIDLDQFKLVNDACGHSVGDQLLCQVTGLLQGCVRSRDTLARLGGDEFGVILEHCTVDQAHRVAQDICDQMEEFRFIHDGRRFRIGTSIGLVPLDKRWAHTASVLQAADTSCYAAKEAGRNRVHAWYDTDQAMRARKGEMQWASRLEQALDENRFILYAQRIQPIRREAMGLHCEVLIRLRDTDGSIIPPGAFLPAAERFHMASRIDRWVVRHVFDWLKQQGEALDQIDTIAVNLSGQSIGDPTFHRFMQELIAETSIDVRKLCLEITETAAITNLVDAASFIDGMRQSGVRMALDDFGSGASSFGYLKTLPVDYLKIDGQFIKDIVNDPLDQATVRCFCEVAHLLGIKTVAEFVETEAVLQTLHGIGVDHAQGYLVHKPQPLCELLTPVSCTD